MDPRTEPIPAECLPFGGDEIKLADLLRGPQIDTDGLVIGDGLWAGMTAAEVIAQRDSFRRACGE